MGDAATSAPDSCRSLVQSSDTDGARECVLSSSGGGSSQHRPAAMPCRLEATLLSAHGGADKCIVQLVATGVLDAPRLLANLTK